MCTFYSNLPKHSVSTGTKKRSLVMSLKPCQDANTYYRVRLLAFSPSKESRSDRDYPFITRFVHQRWGVNKEKGYPVLEDEITCPVTPHVHVEGNRYDACKVCGIANKYFINFKESGWKDKDACKKNKEFGRKYQAIIPVYVVNNPNWEGDNGKFKVIIFNDKKFYTDFCKKIERASQGQCVFNGKNAVDCCLHVVDKKYVSNEGQPNEYTYTKREIDKIVFSTKPYDIQAITKEAVEGMGFDDEYYTTSSPDEIDAFYRKYCTISNDDIPVDSDVAAFEPVREAPSHVNVQNENAAPREDIPESVIDDLTKDIDGKPDAGDPLSRVDDLTTDIDNFVDSLPGKLAADVGKTETKPSEDIDTDALMAELNLD